MTVPAADTAESRLHALSRKPRAARRLAVLADADLAFGVLRALAAAGYGVRGVPADTMALRAALAVTGGETIMLGDYAAFHATLPAALRDAVEARWGAAERDPLYRPGQVDCGQFTIPATCFGTVAVIEATNDGPVGPPRHHVLAAAAWIADIWRADTVIALRPPAFASALPVLVAAAGVPDTAQLLAALDGDAAALRRWRIA